MLRAVASAKKSCVNPQGAIVLLVVLPSSPQVASGDTLSAPIPEQACILLQPLHRTNHAVKKKDLLVDRSTVYADFAQKRIVIRAFSDPQADGSWAEAAHVALEIGLTDGLVGAHLDLMADVLRTHELPTPTFSCHTTDVPDVFVGMTIEAHVPVGTGAIFALNVELADRMQQAGIEPHPRFAVLFSGTIQ